MQNHLTVILFLLSFCALINATHFRGGSLTWASQPNGSTTFYFISYWNVSFIQIHYNFSMGDGNTIPQLGKVVANNSLYTTVAIIFNYKYPPAINKSVVYTVTTINCCRISFLRSGANENYKLQTSVTVGVIPRSSASSNLPPILTFGIGVNTLLIPSIKNGTWSMATSSQSGLSIPNFATRAVNPISISNNGVLNWTTTASDVGWWATQIRLSSTDGFIAIDFLIYVQPVYIDDNPPTISFNPSTNQYALLVGASLNFQVQCSTVEPGNVKIETPVLYDIGMALGSVPGGSSVSPIPTAGNNVVSSIPFTWSQAIIVNGATFEDYVLVFTCTNLYNNLTSTGFIEVSVAAPLTITCPPPETVSCFSAPTVFANVTDGCSGTPVITYSDASVPSNCTGGTYNRVWTATNDCLQSVNCTQVFTINDLISPLITNPPPAATVQCYSGISPAQFSTPLVTDNCDPAPVTTVSDSASAGTSNCQNTIVRTFTATDECGNSATATQTITVQDTTAPTITPFVSVTQFACPDDVNLQAQVVDNCDASRVVVSNPPTGCGNFTLSWTAADSCGNVASSSLSITVSNSNSPSCQASPASVSCPSGATSVPAPTCASYCDDPISPTLLSVTPTVAGNCTTLVTRAWLAVDNCGNSFTYNQYIIVNDNVGPTLSVPGNYHGETGNDISPSTTGQATAFDNCDNVIIPKYEDNVDAGSDNCTQLISRVWTATDSCGNEESEVQHIVLTDTTLPSYVAPSAYIGQCASQLTLANTGVPTVTDTNTVNVTYSDGTSTGSGNTNCSDTHFIRTWTATDSCGNTVKFYQSISIVDVIPPVLIIPGNTSVECAAKANTSITGTATAHDNCGDDLVPDYSDAVSAALILRTWTVSDRCGNTASGVQQIIVDNSLPLLSVPQNINVYCDSSSGPDFTGYASSSDNCVGTLIPTYHDVISGSCPTVISRTWSVTDPVTGQSVSKVQTITVGHPAPSLNVPADVSIQCPTQTGTDFTGIATASALCNESVNVTFVDAPSSGLIQRTWSTTDSCGRVTSAVQKITLKDTIPPTIYLPPHSSSTPCDTDVSVASNGQATATDNCNTPQQVVISNSDEIVINIGQCNSCPSLRRNWTAVDTSGNVAYGIQNIDVFAEPPEFNSSVSNVRLYCLEELGSVAPLSAEDSCGNPLNATSVDSISNIQCGYSIQRTWSSTDHCGTSSSFVQSITIQDTILPTLTQPSPVQVECLADVSVTGVVIPSDNCVGVRTPYYVDYSAVQGCPISIDRRWYVKDACGNAAIGVKQSITILKVTAPTLIVPPDANLACGDATTPDLTGTGAASALDVCGNALTPSYSDYIYEENDGTTVILRTWSATDDCGNSDAEVQTIRIAPDVPVVTPPANFLGICGSDTSPNTTGFPSYTVQCGTVDVEFYDPVGCPLYGSFMRKWTVSRGGSVFYSGYQTITTQDCQPEATAITNLTGELGPRPYVIWPVVHIDDLDIPCEAITLIWIWSDGSNSTQVCNVASPCSDCVFSGTGLDATYGHTYAYPGTYSVQVFAYDSRAHLPDQIPDAQVGNSIVTGFGWLSLTYGYISVFDPTTGSASGTATYFSDESYAVGYEELAGNAFLVFGASFSQVGVSLTSTGLTTLIIGQHFNFTSTSYQHLTIAPGTGSEAAHVIVTGLGQVNGVDGYSFYLFGLDSGSNSDLVRVQISDASGNIIYDTFPGNPADTETVPSTIPNAVGVTVLLVNPPPSTISAIISDQPNSTITSAFLASPAPYTVGVIVLGILLLISVVVCVILFLKLRAVKATVAVSQSDSFQKL
jgi:hypothetical protein